MNPPKAQEGLWPDGSSGAMPIYFGPDMAHHHPESVTIPVVPATLAAELAEAMAECIQLASEGWEYASPYFREKWECEKEIAKAQAALDSYRARMGEGKQ